MKGNSMNLKMISLITVALLLVNVSSVLCEETLVENRLEQELENKLEQEFKWLKAESYVWSASKHEQKTSEAPSSVSVITSDDIRKLGYRTLADILQSVSGFHTTYDRRFRDVGARGFKIPGDHNTKILVLIDGHRMNDNLFHAGVIGSDFVLDVDLIDRVEITRGPGSCLYGAEAFFGVINVISKKAEKINGTEISAEAGSLDTYKGRVSYGKKYSDNADVLFSASGYDSKGNEKLYFKEFDNPSTNNGVAENLDGEELSKFFFRTTFQDLTLTAAHGSQDRDRSLAVYGTWFDKPSDAIERRSYAELKYDHSSDKDTNVFSRFYYDLSTTYLTFPYKGKREDGTPYVNYDREKYVAEWVGSELKLTRKIFDRHNVTLGAEYQYNISQDINAYNEDPYDPWLDDKNSSAIWAVYLQDELKITDQLILNAGLRYDHYESFGGTANPRFALIYSPKDMTTVKLIYGTAFRSPTTFESLTDKVAHGGPTLNPEKITTYEAVVEQRFGKYYRGFVSGFYYKIDGLITQVPFSDAFNTVVNKGDATAKGMEAEIRAEWENGLKASLNYTLQDVGNTEIALVSPRHLIKANVVVPLIQNKIFLSSEGQYMSSRKTHNGEVDGFFIMNTTLLSMNIVKRLEFSASVYNLFDKIYSDPGSPSEYRQDAIEQNGRTFRVKLTYSF
jgi:outer membrane receptor for ferrienterochelin and colicins